MRCADEQLANIVIFAVSLGSNVYSVAGPEDMYGSGKVTYITPSYYVSFPTLLPWATPGGIYS